MGVFQGQTVLITGGTGFLGKNLTKRILEDNPKVVRLFSRDEAKHHKAQQELGEDSRLRYFIGDVRDYERLKRATRGCDIVIHTAALKRIDMMEYNTSEAIKTNILGTLNVVEACTENKVKKVIMVSTDKACEPINIYGACKFVSERIFIESNYSKGGSYPQFTCVRYGNVLSSTGSVIPIFIDKIRKGHKIPLTHPEMTRFIINAEQAVDLIFAAIQHGVGGEIFVPILPSFKITQLISALGQIHGKESEIEIIGIRPGEKLHELMINEHEIGNTYLFGKYLVITSHIQKYNLDIEPVYVREGRKMSLNEMKEFSSGDTLISDDSVRDIISKELSSNNYQTGEVLKK